MRLWVSAQTHKKLGIHDSCPHSLEKAEQSENLLCWRTGVTEHIDQWCPENWREKQMERLTVYQEQKSLESGKGRKIYCCWKAARGSGWTSLRVKISWGLSFRPPSPLLWILPPGAPPSFHSEDHRKIPHASSWRRGSNHFEIY